jgi:hypothetical protein
MRRLFLLPALALPLALVAAAAAGDSFDKPLRRQRIPVPNELGNRARVTCYFYAHFMVKEVDMGEVGAERLGIVPVAAGATPACSRERSKNELVVDPKDWSGYFKGVKGDFVFFSADDGVNGGMGFAVYNASTGRKLFDDVAQGEIRLEDQPNGLKLAYVRVADASCNMLSDTGGCWKKATAKLALGNASMPDCRAGYDKAAHALAKGRCQAARKPDAACEARELKLAVKQTNAAPSVLVYPVEVQLDSKAAVKSTPGTPIECRPSD